MLDDPLAETPPPASDTVPTADAAPDADTDSTSKSLAILFLILVGVLVFLAATAPVVGAVGNLLAGSAQGCGGP